MALDEALYTEIQRSRDLCMARHNKVREMIARYHTPQYNGLSGVPEPENRAWRFAVSTIAKLATMRPRVRLRTRRKVSADRVHGLELHAQRWRRDTSWLVERERILLDMCFGTGVALVSQRPAPGFEQSDDPIYMTTAVRMSPGLFGYDTDASSVNEARYLYHIVMQEKEEFLEMAQREGWDMEACRALAERSADDVRQRSQRSSGRQVVSYWDIWCPRKEAPEIKKLPKRQREKYHGTTYIYAELQDGGLELRKPEGYFGPRQGRYVVGGFMRVPDETAFLGPLIAGDGVIQQHNAQARANDKAAANRKRIALFNSATEDGKIAVLNAEDGDALSVPGFDASSMKEAEIGGISQEARAREIELGVRADRALFMSDATTGDVSGVGTATENMIAASSQSQVGELWKLRARELDGGVALRAAWYADQDERTVLAQDGEIVLGGATKDEWRASAQLARKNGMLDDAGMAMAEQSIESREEDGGSFDDLEIEVQLTGTDPNEQQRLAMANTLLQSWLPILPQVAVYAPGLGAVFQRFADALEIEELAEVADIDTARKIGAAMLQGGMQPEPAGNGAPQMPEPQAPARRFAPTGKPMSRDMKTLEMRR